ncbi:MAG: MFS transporter, partial [Candidatus Eremiobacteraeota bacterium]|nr:MFS transporter [Candidatus Eremiobacteraeota bacterium]
MALTQSVFSLFSSRDFRLFYAGQATSYLGDGLRTIAVPLLVFQMTGSAFNLGGTYATEVFTFGLFSLVGGSLADRLDRRRLMIACDVVRFAILAAFATAAWGKWLTVPWLFVGIAVHAACGAIF